MHLTIEEMVTVDHPHGVSVGTLLGPGRSYRSRSRLDLEVSLDGFRNIMYGYDT
jgi:hypothetical protein